MTVRKAIFPAAGLGTRFLPVTKAQPKEMLPLVDKPTIQYGVEEAIESGIEQVIMVTGGGKRAIVDHFDRSIQLEHYLRERDKQDLLGILEEVDRAVEVVDNRALAAAGDHDHLLDSARDRLFDAVLDCRLVDQGQHLFRLRLGHGQEARAETGGREDRLADGHDRQSISWRPKTESGPGWRTAWSGWSTST